MPKTFWPEAINWSVHILNQSPVLVILNMTPRDAWSGRKQNFDHFRVFGCIFYAYIPDIQWKKLDDKGDNCVLLGVSGTFKAYKLYNPLTQKIKISTDVAFDEESTWNWNEKISILLTFEDDEDDEDENHEDKLVGKTATFT